MGHNLPFQHENHGQDQGCQKFTDNRLGSYPICMGHKPHFPHEFVQLWLISCMPTLWTVYTPWVTFFLSRLFIYQKDHHLTRIAVCQEGTNRQQNLWNSQRRTPVVFQNIQTDDSLTVDVAVIDPSTERNLKVEIQRYVSRCVCRMGEIITCFSGVASYQSFEMHLNFSTSIGQNFSMEDQLPV